MRIPLLVSGNPNVLVFYYTGNGSATFDPSVITSADVNVSWKPDDAPETVTSGTTHNFSYTPSAGSHKCIVRVLVAGGLGLVTTIDCNLDAIVYIKNLQKLSSLSSIITNSNSSYQLSLSTLPRSVAYVHVTYLPLLEGYIADVPPYRYFHAASSPRILGGLSSLSPKSGADLALIDCVGITGSLADVSANHIIVYLYQSTGITPGSIAHLTAIRDIRIYSMWADAASVDTVIESIWDARANYTYATPSLQIGGTNPAPTGNYIAPEEGADWHNDGSKWIPLTPNAKAYDLGNDVNDEGFNTWTISKN